MEKNKQPVDSQLKPVDKTAQPVACILSIINKLDEKSDKSTAWRFCHRLLMEKRARAAPATRQRSHWGVRGALITGKVRSWGCVKAVFSQLGKVQGDQVTNAVLADGALNRIG